MVARPHRKAGHRCTNLTPLLAPGWISAPPSAAPRALWPSRLSWDSIPLRLSTSKSRRTGTTAPPTIDVWTARPPPAPLAAAKVASAFANLQRKLLPTTEQAGGLPNRRRAPTLIAIIATGVLPQQVESWAPGNNKASVPARRRVEAPALRRSEPFATFRGVESPRRVGACERSEAVPSLAPDIGWGAGRREGPGTGRARESSPGKLQQIAQNKTCWTLAEESKPCSKKRPTPTQAPRTFRDTQGRPVLLAQHIAPPYFQKPNTKTCDV